MKKPLNRFQLFLAEYTGALLVAVDRELGPEFIEDIFEEE